MKSLFIVFILIIIFQLRASKSSQQDCETKMDDKEFFLSLNNINDTISDIINNKKFLYYITGHHGHIWSIVIPQNDYYILYAGDTRSNRFRCDTILTNDSALIWGMDSLPLYCHEMKPIHRDIYWPFYKRITLFSADKEKIYDYSDVIGFDGVDNESFNIKYNRLLYYMYYHATPPEIQAKLPVPK